MIIKYNVNFSLSIIKNDIKRIINQVYKLLPLRLEKGNWKKPLETVMLLLVGMKRLFLQDEENFFILLCKLEGMFELTEEEDFLIYRRTIFECLSLLGKIKENV